MRTVAFVENIEFDCQGNVFSKAVTVGDVDNDQDNEFVLGTMHGDLYIFKGKGKKPWATATDLGTITCLLIGDVCNQGMNCLTVLTSEGWCHVFLIQYDHIPQDESVSVELRKPISIKSTHKQHILANNKVLLSADINGDGLNELVIGYSDRQVRMYRWKNFGESLPQLGVLNGQFELIDTWHLAGQLGSLTVNQRKDGQTDLMVSQPGGTFATLYSSNSASRQEKMPEGTSEAHSEACKGPHLIFHPLGSARARNIGVTTEVVANIRHQQKGVETDVPNYSAICTLDGTLTLVDGDKILWSIFVDHQLFSLTKLDITGDGREEVVVCSWDGHTYLVNLSKEVVRFKFRENVAAFCAGHYAVRKNVNVPCLFYVTFNNKIVVYYNLNMPKIANMTLVEQMEQQESLPELLQHFNCDASNTSQVTQLYNWCLYGFRPKPV